MLSYQLGDHIFNSLDEDTKLFFNNGSTDVSTQRNYHGEVVPWVYKNGEHGMTYKERYKSFQNGDGGCPYSDSPSIKNILGTSKSEYQPQPADYKIDMRLNANALTISIMHQATVDFNNLEIHLVITEKTHTYDTAPGTNGQLSFSNSVVKHMGSTVVTALTPNDQQEISYDLS